jgi:hypothetical protein
VVVDHPPAELLDLGHAGFLGRELADCTSAMPPCAAFSVNLRSLEASLLDGAFVASFADGFIALPLAAAAVVPTSLAPCVFAVSCAPAAADRGNASRTSIDTSSASIVSESVGIGTVAADGGGAPRRNATVAAIEPL